MNRLTRTFLIVFLGAIIAYGFYLLPTADDFNESKSRAVAEDFVPEYSLINQAGESVSEKTYADEYQMVYFGFTFCPDICPTELQKITETLNNTSPKIVEQIQPIFISVDPERDTSEVLKQYLSSFHPKFVGFTGTEKQVDVAIDGFKIYAAKIDDPELSDYMINHSSYIYLIAPNGDLLALYKKDDTPDDIKAGLEKFIKESGSRDTL